MLCRKKVDSCFLAAKERKMRKGEGGNGGNSNKMEGFFSNLNEVLQQSPKLPDSGTATWGWWMNKFFNLNEVVAGG